MDKGLMSSTLKGRYGKWINEECVPALVSVIIPTYNRVHFLVEAMESVLKQTYRPIELIVVDDGSTDNTREVVRAWNEKRPKDNAFDLRYFYQKNRGASSARNHGLIESKGEYIQYLDSDDLISPWKLSLQVPRLSSCGNKVAVYGPWRYIHRTNKKFELYEKQDADERNDQLLQWIKGWFIIPNSLLFKRVDVKELGPWDESLTADEDGDYSMRFLANGGQFTYCHQSWTYYRNNPNSSKYSEHVSDRVKNVDIRARIRVVRKIERTLSQQGLLNDKYRYALSLRYYGIAWKYTLGHKTLRQLCLREFKKVFPNDRLPKPIRYPLTLRIFGFRLTQILRYFIRRVLCLRAHLPIKSVETIEELMKFDKQ
jgi:glycosyltransferase involved in cell wall biosynthesis